MRYLFIYILTLFVSCEAQENCLTSCSGSILPINPARTISFVTNVGSYLDVDISPDGKTVLFSMLGEIFTVPVSGGNARQLTRGLGVNYFPKWSPNGKLIAYSSDISGTRTLHIRNVKGNYDQVFESADPQSISTSNKTPLWMPGGMYVAFGSFLYALAGGSVNIKDVLTSDGSVIGFSNNGQFLYTRELINDSCSIRRWDQYKNEFSVIKNDQSVQSLLNPVVSPDGNWICYLMRTGFNDDTIKLMAYHVSEKKERFLAFALKRFPGNLLPHFCFSPDSKYVLIGYGGKLHQVNVKTGVDNLIPFTAKVKIDLGPLNYNTFRITNDSLLVNYTRSANASPDGKHLVFSALSHIYIMDLPGGKPRLLTNQPDNQFYPQFSPDGKWIAYISWSDTAGGQVWQLPSGGGEPVLISKSYGRYQYLSWSPDGRKLVVTKAGLEDIPISFEPGLGKIVVIDVNSGKEEVVADHVSFFNSPQFNADGSSIIYQTDQLEQKIVEKNLVLKSTALLSGGWPFLDEFRQVVISPDKRYIVYTKNENLFLVPVAIPGNPMKIDHKSKKLSVIRFAEGGFDPHFRKDGTLSWSYCNKYYEVNPDKIVQLAILQHWKQKASTNENFIKVTITPDKVIDINLTVPCSYGKGTIALKDARIISMRGNDVIEKGIVIIRNGRIKAVGRSNEVKMPPTAHTIDLSGKTIMPGLIDVHLHYQTSQVDIFPQQLWKLMASLAYGVTTARNPSAGHDEFGYSEMLQAGKILGPRLYSSGQAVRDHYGIDNYDEARSVVGNHKIDNGTFIKQYNLPTRMQHQWLLQASKQAHMNLTNECDRNPLDYIGMVKDGSTGIEHNPYWGEQYDDVITFLARSGTYFTPTIQESNNGEPAKYYFRKKYYSTIINKLQKFTPLKLLEDNFSESEPKDTINPSFIQDARNNAAILHKGGKICMGSHGEDQGIGAHFEIWALQMGGLTNMEALRCATLYGAEALGLQKDLGSIEAGKIADLIILDKNPLDDIHNTNTIKYVMKYGILYDADTLDEVWPEKKKCPK